MQLIVAAMTVFFVFAFAGSSDAFTLRACKTLVRTNYDICRAKALVVGIFSSEHRRRCQHARDKHFEWCTGINVPTSKRVLIKQTIDDEWKNLFKAPKDEFDNGPYCNSDAYDGFTIKRTDLDDDGNLDFVMIGDQHAFFHFRRAGGGNHNCYERVSSKLADRPLGYEGCTRGLADANSDGIDDVVYYCKSGNWYHKGYKDGTFAAGTSGRNKY